MLWGFTPSRAFWDHSNHLTTITPHRFPMSPIGSRCRFIRGLVFFALCPKPGVSFAGSAVSVSIETVVIRADHC